MSGHRNTVTYLGFQVLAGTGLTPRRQAAYVSDRDLDLDAAGRFSLVLAVERAGRRRAGRGQWVAIPEDASGIVVRQYVSDRARETLAEFAIEPLDHPGPPDAPSDAGIAAQFIAMAWTIAKLTTLHETIRPDLMEDAQPVGRGEGGGARGREHHP